jgi:exopolysaccharide biosynthesis polyprenyl glycosylphosphotransferase
VSSRALFEKVDNISSSVGYSRLIPGIATSQALSRAREAKDFLRRAFESATGNAVRYVLIVGDHRQGRELADFFERNPKCKRVVQGFVDDSVTLGGKVLGRIDQLAQIARTKFVDEVILTMPCGREQALRVVQQARQNRLDLLLVPDLFGCDIQEAGIECIGRLPTIRLHKEPIPTFGLFLKRLLDVLLATAATVLLSPMLIVIGVLVKLGSVGPVFYAAPRVGKKGRHFLFYKFRTMVTGSDEWKEKLRSLNQREGPCFKLADDPRVTKIGRFLRRYSLDELPQLFNVLRGEMSLVGPRPHPVDDYDRYDTNHLRRLDVTPGLTGLWQVTAREDPSFQTNLARDLEYIERWTLGLDLRILLTTVAVVLRGNGV